jgi:peptidoglycan/LPS O-acetylase OafA/YrhL
MLGGVALYCVVLAKPSELAQIRGDALATLGYVANWRAVFAHHDYWSLFQAPSPLQHTWSLAIEEQFYLLWPLVVVGLLAAAKRRTPAAVLVVAATGTVASSALMAWAYDPANVSRVYYGTDTRAASILVGAALAAALAIWGPARSRAARIGLEVVGLGAIAFLVWAWVSVPGQSSFLYHGGFLLCGVAAGVVIAAAAHPRRALIARALAVRPLCMLGIVSYGVYLWHWPVYIVLDESRTGLRGYPLLIVRAAVTLSIAAVSYLGLERPIRRGALSIRQSRVAIPAIASILLVVIVASTAGAKPRISVADAAPESVHAAVRRAAAAPVGIRRVMVVGNSVGWFLGRALERSGATPPIVAFNAARPACVFPSGVRDYRVTWPGGSVVEPATPCDQHWTTDLAQFRPNLVLWVVSPGTDEALYHGTWTHLCEPVYDTEYRRDLDDAVRGLHATGAQVVLTTAAYVRFGFPNSQRDQRVDCDNAIRRDVARATGAQLVDLWSYTCPDGVCRNQIDGVVLRPDGLHYEGRSARIVVRWILHQITRVHLAGPRTR